MTGINDTKIIQNLEFVNSFAPHHCSRARCFVLSLYLSQLLTVGFLFFRFPEIGSGTYGTPPGERGVATIGAARAFSIWDPEFNIYSLITVIGALIGFKHCLHDAAHVLQRTGGMRFSVELLATLWTEESRLRVVLNLYCARSMC